MGAVIILSMSGTTNGIDGVTQFLSDLAKTTKSEKCDLELRRIRKIKEKKRLKEKIKKRQERMKKLVMEMKTDDKNLKAVCHEIQTLDIEINRSASAEIMDTE